MAQACEGIRVLDFTRGMSGSLATMVLADYGAEVIRVEPRSGDPGWSYPGYLLWNRGKKSIELDLESQGGREQARGLAQSVDVLVENFRPGVTERLGIGYGDLSPLNPALVYCSITGFGPVGPYKHLKGYEGIVYAKSGRMNDQQGWHADRPIFRAIHDASYGAAMVAVQGILAALRALPVTGRGQHVETSLLDAITNQTTRWLLRPGETISLDVQPSKGRNENQATSSFSGGMCIECGDGRWIMHSNIEPHLFRAWTHSIGFDWIWEDARFKGAPRAFPDDRAKEELNRLVRERYREKSSAEWMQAFIENGDVAAEVMNSTQEGLRHPQVVENGHLVEVDDPRVGRVLQIGALVDMSETPAVIEAAAPRPGEHTQAVLAAPPRSNPPPKPTDVVLRRPLEGILVLELAGYYAAPFGATLLADLGARVIKIEPLTGDPFRNMGLWENMARPTQGKESITLNLKAKEGQAILQRLAAKADILMHNFRPDVPPRLGFDYETLRKINPKLVYLYAASYGSTGPNAHRPAFNPTMGALSGNSVYQSGQGNLPMGDNSPDPISAFGVGTALMLGLTAALRTGKGQYMESTMMSSCLLCNSEDALDYAGKPSRRVPGELQLGLHATYRLYAAREGWVFLAAPQDGEFRGLCKALGREDLVKDPRFRSAAERYANSGALSDILESIFKTRSADDWESSLAPQDVGCVRADRMGHKQFLHLDPHTTSIGFMMPVEGPEIGEYLRHRPLVHFSDMPDAVKGFTGLAQHTENILGELGYSEEEVLGLSNTGVVSMPEKAGVPA